MHLCLHDYKQHTTLNVHHGQKGIYHGKEHNKKPFKSDKFEELYQEYIKRKITKAEFALQIGTSRPTLNKLIKNYEKSSHSDTESK